MSPPIFSRVVLSTRFCAGIYILNTKVYTYRSLQTSLSDRLIHHYHGHSEDLGDKEHERQTIQSKPQKHGWSWRHQHQKPVKKQEWL